jgi:GT2 family glycosyltransferase
MRRDAVLAAGNFNATHCAGEDAELGRRLLNAQWKVVFAPELRMSALGGDGMRSVLRRYARWNNATRQPGWRQYPGLVAYSLRSMIAQDLKARDLPGAMLSLVCPHYQFWTAQRDRARNGGTPRG